MYFDILENRCKYQNTKGYYPVFCFLRFWVFYFVCLAVGRRSLKDIRPHDTPTTRNLGSNTSQWRRDCSQRSQYIPYCLIIENILFFIEPQWTVKNRVRELIKPVLLIPQLMKINLRINQHVLPRTLGGAMNLVQ